MSVKKNLSGQALATVVAAVCLLLSVQVDASIKHKLSGRDQSSSRGFESGGYFSDGHGSSNTLAYIYSKLKGKGHSNNSDDWGSGWKNLSMNLGKKGRNSGQQDQDEEEFSMPETGHHAEAELHYDEDNGLTFEGWYKNPTTNSWHDMDDTKILSADNRSQVPEPLSLLLLSLGLFGMYASKVYRKV